ncbi:hypothetical protein C8Q73DRAFT_108445 [Cubamyces lactineus]|nr:hypothetical protein C8Q73DRAFT_108445 [Cubamyces lactineus]
MARASSGEHACFWGTSERDQLVREEMRSRQERDGDRDAKSKEGSRLYAAKSVGSSCAWDRRSARSHGRNSQFRFPNVHGSVQSAAALSSGKRNDGPDEGMRNHKPADEGIAPHLVCREMAGGERGSCLACCRTLLRARNILRILRLSQNTPLNSLRVRFPPARVRRPRRRRNQPLAKDEAQTARLTAHGGTHVCGNHNSKGGLTINKRRVRNSYARGPASRGCLSHNPMRAVADHALSCFHSSTIVRWSIVLVFPPVRYTPLSA